MQEHELLAVKLQPIDLARQGVRHKDLHAILTHHAVVLGIPPADLGFDRHLHVLTRSI